MATFSGDGRLGAPTYMLSEAVALGSSATVGVAGAAGVVGCTTTFGEHDKTNATSATDRNLDFILFGLVNLFERLESGKNNRLNFDAKEKRPFERLVLQFFTDGKLIGRP